MDNFLYETDVYSPEEFLGGEGNGERQSLSTLTITLTLTIRSDSTDKTDEADF